MAGIPLEVKEIRCLDFARGKELLAKYNEGIAKYGERARQVLGRYSLGDNDLIVGSSPFMNVQLGQTATLASPAQVMVGLDRQPDFFRGTYEDMTLVLRTEGDTIADNDYVAKHLAGQVKARGIVLTPEKPVRISLRGAKLNEDANSTYGLVFDLADAEVIAVPELSHVNHRKRFSKADERGVPIFADDGDKTLYTRDNGLSWLYLDWDLNLRSNGENLAYSFSDGRVPLVVASEAGVQNLGYSQSLINQALATVLAQRRIAIDGLDTDVAKELNRLQTQR